jgi:hypothetical protein
MEELKRFTDANGITADWAAENYGGSQLVEGQRAVILTESGDVPQGLPYGTAIYTRSGFLTGYQDKPGIIAVKNPLE